jgi:hypothetical protein
MNKDEEFRCQAEHAEHEALRANWGKFDAHKWGVFNARSQINQIDREAWLKVAEGWRSLLRKRPQSEDDPESK